MWPRKNSTRKELGAGGEDIAVNFLRRQGMQVIEQNFRGRNGEIDIVALDHKTVCFIEVKTRRSLQFGAGYESVLARKQQKIMKTALLYLKVKGWSERDFRFDVVSILLGGPEPGIEYLKGAFDGF
ncbi:MAG: YraN family protein [Candidatus Omnitrophica bacterium]|nr:YraN family protein [Candidatus Omnitrophota bacterium]